MVHIGPVPCEPQATPAAILHDWIAPAIGRPALSAEEYRVPVAKGLLHLVEDDGVVPAMLKRLLESGGYAVGQCESGRELLDTAEALDPAIVDQLAAQKEHRV